MSEHRQVGHDQAAREQMEFDVVIVGAGPAGLSAAIRLKQLAPDTAVCVVEKGSEVGAHILSGAVIETRALDELLPDWRERGAPLTTPAGEDRFLYLTKRRAYRLPTPPQMHNDGNYIVSLSDVCRWLGAQAEALGVEIYPGFAAAEVLEEDGRVVGVATGDMGITREGEPGGNHQRGMELRATYTLLAEGCRGSLTKKLAARFNLRDGRDPPTYALGVKELWEVPAANHRPGLIEHTVGWPLDRKTYGGSWLYHFGDNGWCRSASWWGWITATRGCRRSRRCSASRPTRQDATAFRGRTAHLATARARSARAGSSRMPKPDLSRAARCWAMHGRLPERAEDQGHAHGDEVRHAGGGRDGRSAVRAIAVEITGRPTASRIEHSWLHRRAARGARNMTPGFRAS